MLQKNRNLVVVLASIVMIFLICYSLVLLSIKFYILQELRKEEATLEETEAKYQTEGFLSILESIEKHNMTFVKINDFYKKEVHFSEILQNIMKIQRPESIVFNNVVLERTDEDYEVKVRIYGKSQTRDDLLSFKDNLVQEKNIKNVTLPRDNLIKPADVIFNLSFNINVK